MHHCSHSGLKPNHWYLWISLQITTVTADCLVPTNAPKPRERQRSHVYFFFWSCLKPSPLHFLLHNHHPLQYCPRGLKWSPKSPPRSSKDKKPRRKIVSSCLVSTTFTLYIELTGISCVDKSTTKMHICSTEMRTSRESGKLQRERENKAFTFPNAIIAEETERERKWKWQCENFQHILEVNKEKNHWIAINHKLSHCAKLSASPLWLIRHRHSSQLHF